MQTYSVLGSTGLESLRFQSSKPHILCPFHRDQPLVTQLERQAGTFQILPAGPAVCEAIQSWGPGWWVGGGVSYPPGQGSCASVSKLGVLDHQSWKGPFGPRVTDGPLRPREGLEIAQSLGRSESGQE